jgi:cysteine desulfurase
MPVYLDHAASTPLDPRVLDVMMPFLTSGYGNPSSVHALGRRARFAVEESRERVAALLGAEPSEVVFTSGATESNSLAIKGVGGVKHILTSRAEHEAVLRPAEQMRERGMALTILETDRFGRISTDALAEAEIGPAALVSLMAVNNETGALHDVGVLSAIARESGALFHTDAVQAAGFYELNVEAAGVDLMSLSGHKIYGPKGAGVLYVRGGIDLKPLVQGGSQERRRRGGTENVPAIVGMTEALHLAAAERQDRRETLMQLTDYLARQLYECLGNAFILNTPGDGERAPHIINVSFPPVDGRPLDGEMLLLNLDMQGVMVSAGSACTSGAIEPSHVLLACGLDPRTAIASVRFSLGKDTTVQQIDEAVGHLETVYRRMTRREVVTP